MFRSLKVIGGIAVALALELVLAVPRPKPANAVELQTEKRVLVPITMKWEPVAVAQVTLGNTVVQLGRMIQMPVEPITPFLANADWIQNLTIYLYNRTNKNIVFAQVYIFFPDTGNGHTQPEYSAVLRWGRIPPSAPDGKPVQPSDLQPISFAPGETMVVHLRDYIDLIRSSVESVMPLEAATQIQIQPDRFFFANGTEYHGSSYFMPDPQDPSKKVRAATNYFPGDPDVSWPGRPDWYGTPEVKKKI